MPPATWSTLSVCMRVSLPLAKVETIFLLQIFLFALKKGKTRFSSLATRLSLRDRISAKFNLIAALQQRSVFLGFPSRSSCDSCRCHATGEWPMKGVIALLLLLNASSYDKDIAAPAFFVWPNIVFRPLFSGIGSDSVTELFVLFPSFLPLLFWRELLAHRIFVRIILIASYSCVKELSALRGLTV